MALRPRPADRPGDDGRARRGRFVRWLSGPVSTTRARAARPRVSRARDLPPDGRTDGQPADPSPTAQGRIGGALRTLVRAIRRRAFRHRRTLAPIAVLAALAVLPSIGRALGLSGRGPAIGGAALTVAACLWVDRGRERRYALAVGALATIWCWLAWAFDGAWLRLALLVLWLPAAVLWWRHQRVRSRIEVTEYPVRLPRLGEWGSWRPQLRRWWDEHRYRRRSRRALRRIWEDWRRTASAAEVPGCRIRRATADRVAYTLHVDLRRGQTHRRMVGHLDELGSALKANVGTLRIELEQRMDRVRIRWVHHDPLAGAAIPWPYAELPEVHTALGPITLGLNEHGEPVQIRLADGEHTQVVGLTDLGKSGVLNVMIGAAAAMRDVVLWGIDPAGGVEFGPWGSVFERMAEDAGAAAGLVGAVERVVSARLEKLRVAGARNWEPGLGPYVVLLIDELAQLPPALRRRLTKVVLLCRKCGIRIVAATQHPSVEDTGSSLRAQLDRVICLRLKSEAVRLVFDADDRAAGWDPTRLMVPGSFLIKSRRHQEPITARAYWLDDATVAAAAARLAAGRPALDPESAAAAGGVGEGHPSETARPPVLELVPVPEEPDEREERLRALGAAIREAGPLSGRAAAERAGLPRTWVAEVGLPELKQRGEIEQTAAREWRWVEAAGAEGGAR